jgi:hypothetical protein
VAETEIEELFKMPNGAWWLQRVELLHHPPFPATVHPEMLLPMILAIACLSLTAALGVPCPNDVGLYCKPEGRALQAQHVARHIRDCLKLHRFVPTASVATSGDWLVLSNDLSQFLTPAGEWYVAGNARVAAGNSRQLQGDAGLGVLINGKTGKTDNLVTRGQWGDVEVSLEFLIPRGSNSGVKLQGLYEIQIADSCTVGQPTGSDCGGIYPCAELESSPPKYYHIDEGIAPLVNAAKSPGLWQTLEIVFHAPRFDQAGKKTVNACFAKVLLNGKLIHDHVEVAYPTGHLWREPERAIGPLLLQADHGPVAFRNVRLRPLR